MTAPSLAPLTVGSSAPVKLSPDSIPLEPGANDYDSRSGYWLTLVTSGALHVGDYDVSSSNASLLPSGTSPPFRLEDGEELWAIAPSGQTVTAQRFATNVKTGPVEGWGDSWGDLPWGG